MAGQCYQDDPDNRLLDQIFIDKENNCPEKCQSKCRKLGYKYAGVQNGEGCHCGNEAPPESKIVSFSECKVKCSGDNGLICGASSRMNVFTVDKRTGRQRLNINEFF